MRNSIYGHASISPNEAKAGQRGTREIQYVVGKAGIREGGGLRIITPPTGLDLWELGKVLAFTDNRNAHLEVETEHLYPQTYHHSHYPAAEIILYGCPLVEGESIRIVLGALGGYLSGRFLLAKAQSHTCVAPFELFVDPLGNARFSRELIRDYAYHEVPGSLSVIVKPAPAAKIRCSIRNSPGEDLPMIGVVAIEDEFENPIADERFEIRLFAEEGDIEAKNSINKPGKRAGTKFTVRSVGQNTNRLGATHWPHGLYGVSNPIRPNFFGENQTVYLGDMHVMTGAYGSKRQDGNTESALKYARDVFGLDFTAITNSLSVAGWPSDRELFKKYNKDYEFVTLPAYENGLSTGHKNVYFPKEPAKISRARTAKELWKCLANTECQVISHHTNTHSETDPETSWSHHHIDTINPQFERLIEICQNRGSFERDEVGEEVSFGGFRSSIRDVLATGLRLGFVGGTDSHRGRPGSSLSNQSGLDARANVTGGITGVVCGELTRRAIWDALMARRCYAATSERILLDIRLNGLPMGRDMRLTRKNRKRFDHRTVAVRVIGTQPIDRVVIVRNGIEVFHETINGMECKVSWEDQDRLIDIRDTRIKGVYYYAKVYQTDRNIAWTSPIWLSYGR